MTLRGEWNTLIYGKRPNEDEFLFSDVRAKPDVKKVCEVFFFKKANPESRTRQLLGGDVMFQKASSITSVFWAARFIECNYFQ